MTKITGINAGYEIEMSIGPISNSGSNSVNKFARPLSDIAKIKIIIFCDCVYSVLSKLFGTVVSSSNFELSLSYIGKINFM